MQQNISPELFLIHSALNPVAYFYYFFIRQTPILISNHHSVLMHILHINTSMILIQYFEICKCPLSLAQIPLKTVQKNVCLLQWALEQHSLKKFKLTCYPVLDLLFLCIFSNAAIEPERSYKSCNWETNARKKNHGKINFFCNILIQCPGWTAFRALLVIIIVQEMFWGKKSLPETVNKYWVEPLKWFMFQPQLKITKETEIAT